MMMVIFTKLVTI